MKTITTLLLLLLASPVFAETYVCSYLDEEVPWGPNIMRTYIRTPDNSSDFVAQSVTRLQFMGLPRNADDTPFDVVYENEYLLVLHTSGAWIEEGTPDRPTSNFGRFSAMAVIEKTDNFSFRHITVNQHTQDGSETELITRGTCTVVE